MEEVKSFIEELTLLINNNDNNSIMKEELLHYFSEKNITLKGSLMQFKVDTHKRGRGRPKKGININTNNIVSNNNVTKVEQEGLTIVDVKKIDGKYIDNTGIEYELQSEEYI